MYKHFTKVIIPGFCNEIIRKLAKMPEDDRYIEKFAKCYAGYSTFCDAMKKVGAPLKDFIAEGKGDA